MDGPTILELSDFQKYLTTRKGFTTAQAVELCESGKHEDYLRLFAEWEASLAECEGQ